MDTAIIKFSLVFIFLGLSNLWAQYPIAHPNCTNPQSSEFEQTFLFTHTDRSESQVKHAGVKDLIRFDLLKNGDDFDILFGGFEGVLYRYSWESKQITALKDFETIQGSVPNPYRGGDHGVTGIAVHPNFETNRWIFVFYTPRVSDNQNRVMLLSRFEMSAQFQLSNEKVLLTMEATTDDRWHSGGDMYFTAHGDLFLQVGDNVANDNNNTSKVNNAAWTSGNTTNLIGGVVRIHPDSSEAGYSVPKGNFGEHFAEVENNPEYLKPERVKPEIFAKGQRSNFTSTGHPTELIHIWGEVCTGGAHDEINIVDKPIYGGWPHYQGNELSHRTGGTNERYPHDINNNPELSEVVAGDLVEPEAIQVLPKVYPADLVMGNEFNVVAAQALYYYGRGESIWQGRTFPPNFHETFMFARWSGENARMVPLKRENQTVTAEMKDDSYGVVSLLGDGQNQIFNGMSDAKYGPDGALYILARGGQYNQPKSLMTRIDYKGSCQDQSMFDANRQKFVETRATSSDPSRYRDGFFEPEYYSVGIDKQPLQFLKAGELVTFKVYNTLGQVMGSFQSSVKTSGILPTWKGVLNNGKKAEEGIYFIEYLNPKTQQKSIRKQIL